jgi:hypothetical protein
VTRDEPGAVGGPPWLPSRTSCGRPTISQGRSQSLTIRPSPRHCDEDRLGGRPLTRPMIYQLSERRATVGVKWELMIEQGGPRHKSLVEAPPTGLEPVTLGDAADGSPYCASLRNHAPGQRGHALLVTRRCATVALVLWG